MHALYHSIYYLILTILEGGKEFCNDQACSSCPGRQVSIEEGDAKSREFGVMFIETSSKAGFNIKVHAHLLLNFLTQVSLCHNVNRIPIMVEFLMVEERQACFFVGQDCAITG